MIGSALMTTRTDIAVVPGAARGYSDDAGPTRRVTPSHEGSDRAARSWRRRDDDDEQQESHDMDGSAPDAKGLDDEQLLYEEIDDHANSEDRQDQPG